MNTVGRILNRYGETAKICFDNITVDTKVFVQPVLKSGTVYRTHMGTVNDGDYYLFAPGYLKLDADKNMTVTVQSGEYDVERIEKYSVLGNDSHWEGIIKRRY